MHPVQRMLAERNGKGGRQSRFCLAVEMAQKQSIWHYQPLKSCTFLRIVVATPNLVTQARSMHLFNAVAPCRCEELRCMSCEIMELPEDTVKRPPFKSVAQGSRCKTNLKTLDGRLSKACCSHRNAGSSVTKERLHMGAIRDKSAECSCTV